MSSWLTLPPQPWRMCQRFNQRYVDAKRAMKPDSLTKRTQNVDLLAAKMHVFEQNVKAAHDETAAKIAGYKDAVSAASSAVEKQENAVREAKRSLETLLGKLEDARKTGDVVDGVVSIPSV